MRKIILAAVILMLLFGCGKKTHMFVGFYVEREMSGLQYWGYQGGFVYSDPVIKEMTAFINDDSTNVNLPHDYDYYASFNDPDTVPPTVGVEYKFDVKTDQGNMTATCTLPGDFDFTSPLDGDSVSVNSAVPITWNAAAGADWYAVNIQFYDTLWRWKDTLVNRDSTSWTIPAGWLNADGHLTIYVYAGGGPKIEPSAAGNVDGALGFCIATNARYHQIIVGTPTMAPRIRPKSYSSREFMKKYLQEMSKYNEDAAKMLEIMK
jgi:hypothetical protein